LKLPLRQLDRHLEKSPAWVYLAAADEPLLVAQAVDSIRAAARAAGFEERDLHVVDRGFRWNELEAGADNLSLFASRRIVELRMATPRPGDAGARCIRSLAERAGPDQLVIVAVNAKLDASAARSTWVKAIDEHGVVVEIWPIDRAELPSWIGARAARLGLKLTPDAAELLADRVEGNLLAADQELTKLALTGPDRRIDERAVLEDVTNNARFDVFRLSDAIVGGDAVRAMRVLTGLRHEGTQPVLVAWALSREIGLLARLKYAVEHGERIDNALARNGIWRRRQPLVKQAVRRYEWRHLAHLIALCAEVDATIKGTRRGDPWQAVTALVLAAFDPHAPDAWSVDSGAFGPSAVDAAPAPG
jgi:DNA polymerase-3 subunit delta